MSKTQFEEDFGIDLSSPNLDIVKAVEVAIEIEKMGKQFYEYYAEKADPEARMFLEFLAKEKEKHIEILKELRASLKLRNAWIELKQDREIEGMLENLQVFKEKLEIKVESVDMIMKCIENEKKTREFYERLAENVKSEEGRKFFQALAKWEDSHYKLLGRILKASTSFSMEM